MRPAARLSPDPLGLHAKTVGELASGYEFVHSGGAGSERDPGTARLRGAVHQPHQSRAALLRGHEPQAARARAGAWGLTGLAATGRVNGGIRACARVPPAGSWENRSRVEANARDPVPALSFAT